MTSWQHHSSPILAAPSVSTWPVHRRLCQLHLSNKFVLSLQSVSVMNIKEHFDTCMAVLLPQYYTATQLKKSFLSLSLSLTHTHTHLTALFRPRTGPTGPASMHKVTWFDLKYCTSIGQWLADNHWTRFLLHLLPRPIKKRAAYGPLQWTWVHCTPCPPLSWRQWQIQWYQWSLPSGVTWRIKKAWGQVSDCLQFPSTLWHYCLD